MEKSKTHVIWKSWLRCHSNTGILIPKTIVIWASPVALDFLKVPLIFFPGWLFLELTIPSLARLLRDLVEARFFSFASLAKNLRGRLVGSLL